MKKEILNQATRFQIKSRNKGPSKKLDCPVIFAVRKIYVFPEYPLENDTKRNRALIAQKIRARLARIKKEKCTCEAKEAEESEVTSNDLPGRVEYLTKLPGTGAHNHDVTKAANFMKLRLKKLGTRGILVQNKKPVCLIKYLPFKPVSSGIRQVRDYSSMRKSRVLFRYSYTGRR